MVDVLTPEQRKKNMSAIKGKDTKPEMIVRRLVHSMGYRYRLHRRDLPGTPDLVFTSRSKVIFVHGCFWHVHTCADGQSNPKTNSKFWLDKRTGNVTRDERNLAKLKDLGWDILVIWECEVKDDALAERICRFLDD